MNDLNILKQKAESLTGLSLGQLANSIGATLKLQKGWIGQLIELALQAEAGSRPMPDFPELGVELKTIPIDSEGRAQESTFVCTINLANLTGATWKNSLVKKKLSHVLWVPIQSDDSIPFYERRIGEPFFWKPDEATLQMLRDDWQELTDKIQMGEYGAINALHGTLLQVRPKGQNARSLRGAFDESGEPCVTLPRGFYLRARFTNQILANQRSTQDNLV